MFAGRGSFFFHSQSQSKFSHKINLPLNHHAKSVSAELINSIAHWFIKIDGSIVLCVAGVPMLFYRIIIINIRNWQCGDHIVVVSTIQIGSVCVCRHLQLRCSKINLSWKQMIPNTIGRSIAAKICGLSANLINLIILLFNNTQWM